MILLVICLLNHSNLLLAQANTDTIKIHFETFSAKDGLSQGFVCSILQDKEGYMWFATKDGLNKYDGYEVIVYRNNPQDKFSIPDNYIRQLVEDDAGNIWIGTSSKGLCIFDKRRENFYNVPLVLSSGELKNESIRVLNYRNGKLLVTTSNNTFVFDVSQMLPNNYNALNFKKIRMLFNYNEFQKSQTRKLPFISQDFTWIRDNELWSVLTDSVYVFKAQNSFKHILFSAYPAEYFGLDGINRFKIVWSDSSSIIFISNESIIVYNLERKQVVRRIKLENTHNSVCNAITDVHQNLLIENGNQYYFNTHTFDLTPLISYPYSIGNCIAPGFIDRTGLLWIGSNASTGILKFDERKAKFHTFYFPNSYTYFQVQTGELFFSNNGKNTLLNYKTGKLSEPHTIVPSQYYDWNYKAQDRSGNCYSGVTVLANHKVAIYKNTLKKSADKILCYQDSGACRKIFFDNNDEAWGLLESKDFSRSLVRFDKESGIKKGVYRFPIENDANEYLFISGQWQDKNNVFWFATLQGLFSFNENKQIWHQWKNIPSDSTSISTDMLFSVCPDPKHPDKYLWIGTNGAGLNRFEFATGRCIRYSEKDGLPNNVVYGMLSDEKGNLWMSTNKGMSCFNPEEKTFRNFTESDGLQGDEFNRYQSLKLNSGELLFGGVNGLTIFNPEEVLVQNPAPQIVLTKFSVFNKQVVYKSDSSIMNAHIGYVKHISLPYDKNMFAIEFAALESSPAKKKQYKYLLEGFNNEWIDNGSKNTVSFTNLDPGQYTFHVVGTNSDGIWSKNEASVIINILPPWWGTWWFRLIVVAIAGITVYFFYRYRLRQALKLYTLRNNIARDLHDEIGSTLSSIALYGESARMMIKEDHPLNNVLAKISNSTNNMMESMSDIVWAINTRNDQFDNIINRMNAFAYHVMEAKGCNIHFEIGNGSKDPELNMEQRKNLYLFYKEIINNAAKHSYCTNIWITINSDANILHLIVKDDGIGFDMKEASSKAMGGNGLLNMKKRADLLRASFTLYSSPGRGTETELKMKL